jgi:hypothetical protein
MEELFEPIKPWIKEIVASSTKEEVSKMDIREVVNDPEWQELRKSFIGTWKKTPEENVKKLREYLGDFSDPLKLRRVLNYTTGSGFRMKMITHPEIDKLREEVKKARE